MGKEIIRGGAVRECCVGFSKTHPLISSGTAKLSLPEVETLETLRVTETSHKLGGLHHNGLPPILSHASPQGRSTVLPGSQATLRGSAALPSQVEIRGVIVHDPSPKKEEDKRMKGGIRGGLSSSLWRAVIVSLRSQSQVPPSSTATM